MIPIYHIFPFHFSFIFDINEQIEMKEKSSFVENRVKNDEQKIFELLDEYLHDLKIYGLEVRIEELESKFSKDLSETTFNEIKDLKEQKKKQNFN